MAGGLYECQFLALITMHHFRHVIAQIRAFGHAHPIAATNAIHIVSQFFKHRVVIHGHRQQTTPSVLKINVLQEWKTCHKRFAVLLPRLVAYLSSRGLAWVEFQNIAHQNALIGRKTHRRARRMGRGQSPRFNALKMFLQQLIWQWVS